MPPKRWRIDGNFVASPGEFWLQENPTVQRAHCALKKKIATKRATKVGKSMAKKDGQGKRKAITTSGEERSARATRRNLAKEAPATLDVATGGPLEVSLSITKSRQMYP